MNSALYNLHMVQQPQQSGAALHCWSIDWYLCTYLGQWGPQFALKDAPLTNQMHIKINMTINHSGETNLRAPIFDYVVFSDRLPPPSNLFDSFPNSRPWGDVKPARQEDERSELNQRTKTATRIYDPCTLLGGIEMALYVLLNDCYHSNFCSEDVEYNRLCT